MRGLTVYRRCRMSSQAARYAAESWGRTVRLWHTATAWRTGMDGATPAPSASDEAHTIRCWSDARATGTPVKWGERSCSTRRGKRGMYTHATAHTVAPLSPTGAAWNG